MYSALIVEDDADLATITQTHLVHAGYQVDTAGTCACAEELLKQREYDLILLDEVLPDYSGDELCRAIRARCTCPIIFMSCLDDSDTIISALRSGGDDYMVKPVNYAELLARAEAIIRRAGSRPGRQESHLRQFRQFAIDTTRHKVIRDGAEIELSAIEYALLTYMVEHQDTLLLYRELYQKVWDSDSLGDVRTVMVHISNLRKKVDPNRSGIISTVRNAGYIFSDV